MPEENRNEPASPDGPTPDRISQESAQHSLAALTSDRTTLAEKMPPPKWFYPSVAVAMAAIVATPAFTEPGTNHNLVACLAFIVIALQHIATRRTGVRRSNTKATDIVLTVLMAIIVMGMLSVSLGMNASELPLYWTALPVAVTFGATLGISLLIDWAGREHIRDGQ